jgi:aspartokinase
LAKNTSLVDEVLQRDGSIRKDLTRGLINIRALSRFIQERYYSEAGKAHSLDAIISAVRRYPLQQEKETRASIGALLKKITMRNQIVDIAISNDPEIPSALGKIASRIEYGRGETFRIVAGVESIRVIIDEKNTRMLALIPKEKILKKASDLVEIIVSLDEAAEQTPGVVATITTELSINGINLIEFMSCVPELIMVVEERDALRGYELIQALAKASP